LWIAGRCLTDDVVATTSRQRIAARLNRTRPRSGHSTVTRISNRASLQDRRRSWPAASPRQVSAVRWVAAIVFVIFGTGKFVNHASELTSFRLYGLPAPGVFLAFIGGLEIAGGLMLAAARWVRLAALALAGDMAGAIVVSGLARGEIISLTLAPLLLLGMLFLICVGASENSANRRGDPRRLRTR
jgi:uncharacterized membrane protein YphA (DoxX/SURF4 family)